MKERWNKGNTGLRLHGPIVARFRPRKKTRPNKPRPKAERALGRVFRSYGRVFKTRPQKHFFVVHFEPQKDIVLLFTTIFCNHWEKHN